MHILMFIKKALKILSCITITFLTIIVAMQVVNRNFLDHSFTWVEEMASMLMVYVTYFGAAMATINNSNTRINFFINKLPKRATNIIELIDDFICIVFLGFVIVYSSNGFTNNLNMFTPALHLPVSINYLGLILGCALMVVFYLIHAYIDFFKVLGKNVAHIEEGLNRDE